MAGVSLIYNGVDLSQWFDVTDVQRNIGTSHTNSMTKIGQSDGQLWQYMTRDTKTITISGIVTNANLATLRRDLGAVLDVDEPKQLIIGDNTDVYYLAIYDGQPTIAEDWRSGTISLTFIVPDGVAHSVDTHTANNTGYDGTLVNEFVVTNNGTYPVYPVIEATMHSDNGVISFINEENGSLLEFGNEEEVDGITKQKSEQVIHYTFSGAKPDAGLTVNAGTMFYNDSGRSKIAGSFVDPGSGDAVTPTFTGTSSDRWNGPTLYGAVPASAEGSNTGNFLYTNRINFPAAIGHTGRIELILGNDKGMQMVFVIREATLTRKQIVIEGWCMGQMLVNKTLDLNAFNSDFMGRIGANLLFQIAKISELKGDVPVYASKLSFTPTYPDFTSVPISNMTTWFARFGATNASKLTWTDAKFEWTNISYWNDIANQYSAGDVLTVDVPNSTVALNGVLTGGLQRIGNDWSKFKLQPGQNKLFVVTSSFAKTPEVRIYYKEAYV